MTKSSIAAGQGPGRLEGPCVARAEDLPSLVTLANEVFRPAPRPGDMGREFPVLLGTANLGSQYVFREAGRVVSHVGVLRQTMRTCGVDIPVACIGAVCTHPDHRKAGLAGQLMDLAIQRSIEAGDVLMPISGKRTLYTSRGATSMGPEVRLTVPVQAGLDGAGEFAVCAYEPKDWPRLAKLQAREPVRYLWADREAQLLEAVRTMGAVCLLAERKDGELAAALLVCVNHPMYGGKDGAGRVVQFLGDPQALPALLAQLAGRFGLRTLDWPLLLTARPALGRALRDLGAGGTARITSWTVAILDLAKLVETLAPAAARAGLELAARDGKLTVAAGGLSVTLPERDLQVEVLFRDPATWSRPLAELPVELRVACSAFLPVALPDYGINYV